MRKLPIHIKKRTEIYDFIRHKIGELSRDNQTALSLMIKGYTIYKTNDLIQEIGRLTNALSKKNTLIRQYELKISLLEQELSKKSGKSLILS